MKTITVTPTEKRAAQALIDRYESINRTIPDSVRAIANAKLNTKLTFNDLFRTPGEFGVVHGRAWYSTGIELVTGSWASHAVLYVGNGQIVEAESSGAVLSPADKYIDNILWSGKIFTQTKGEEIAAEGRKLLGTPYSYLGCAAIGLSKITHQHIPKWAQDKLADQGDLFCSQLVDVAYQNAGVQLFDDGRWNGSVTPGDLLDLIMHNLIKNYGRIK